ncbi:MAG: hypothetical protein ACHQ03_10390 [Candidatus Bathyarchaeia archaeon]
MDLSGVVLQVEFPLGLLTQYLRPDFMIFSFMLGYFTLFLSLFTRQKDIPAHGYWTELDWGERFLIGFLLGLILLLFVSAGPLILLSFLAAKRIFLMGQIDPDLVWFATTVCFLFFLAFVRLRLGEPLYSHHSRTIMSRFFTEGEGHLIFLWIPILALVFIAAQAMFAPLLYKFAGMALMTVYWGLCSAVLGFVLLGLWVPTGFVVLIASGLVFEKTSHAKGNGNYTEQITLILRNPLRYTAEFVGSFLIATMPSQILGWNCTLNGQPSNLSVWGVYNQLFLSSESLASGQSWKFVIELEYR